MKIVLIGKNGQLGWEFQHTLPSLGEVISLGRNELDVSSLHAVKTSLMNLKPDLIINTSAYTDVDGAETNIELASQINALAPGIMAETARALGAVFIHYSTDYVFDGKGTQPYKENDPTNPLNIYGRSKLTGEKNIEQAGDAYLILRTSWVYSLRGNSFVNKVLSWARKNTTLKIVSDQISNPTWARTLAEVTSSVLTEHRKELLEMIREKSGIYHLSGGGYTSRYEWAKHILAFDSNPTEQLVQSIEPVSSEEFPTPAKRPLFSALDCSKFMQTFAQQLQDWPKTLKIAMQKL